MMTRPERLIKWYKTWMSDNLQPLSLSLLKYIRTEIRSSGIVDSTYPWVILITPALQVRSQSFWL